MPGQFLGAFIGLAHGGVEDDFSFADVFAVVVDHLERFGVHGNGDLFAGSGGHSQALEGHQPGIQRRVFAALVLAINLRHVLGVGLAAVAHGHVHQNLAVFFPHSGVLHEHVAVGEAEAEGIEGLAGEVAVGAALQSIVGKGGHVGQLFIVIEGHKAGGHLGFSREKLEEDTCQENLDILKEVLEVIKPFEEKFHKKIRVFLGGGIFTGKDMADALKAGADGVQIGTRFITTDECDASDTFKQVIVDSTPDDIRIIKSPVGMPARAVYTPLLQNLEKGKTFFAEKCNNCLTACPKGDKVPYCISRALIAAVEGNREEGLFFCGENASKVKEIVPVKTLINELLTDCTANLSSC